MPLFILVRSQARRPSSFLSLSFVLSMCWFLNDRLLNFSFPDRVALFAAQLINPASQNHLFFLFYDFASSLAHIQHDLLQAKLVKTSAAILAQLFYLFSSFWKKYIKRCKKFLMLTIGNARALGHPDGVSSFSYESTLYKLFFIS